MSDGDLYVQDGEQFTNGLYYPEAPAEQVEAEQEQKGKIASSYPVMDDVADWFAGQIDLSNSVQNVKVYADMNGVGIEDALRAFDIVRGLLEAKAMEFSEFGKEAGNGK